MKKLEIKLRHFEELEAIMDREREAVSGQWGRVCGRGFLSILHTAHTARLMGTIKRSGQSYSDKNGETFLLWLCTVPDGIWNVIPVLMSTTLCTAGNFKVFFLISTNIISG